MRSLVDAWPLFALRLQTPDVVLRVPEERELADLAVRAAGNVVPAERAHFMGPWTQLPVGVFEPSFMQFHAALRGRLSPARWNLELGVFSPVDPGRAIGIMGLAGTDFALTRSVRTGSWLLRDHQGHGLGKQMRTAVLELAFTHLGAREARTSLDADNHASRGVSRALGYVDDGTENVVDVGVARTLQRMRVDRSEFRPACPVTVAGVDECRSLLGLDDGN